MLEPSFDRRGRVLKWDSIKAGGGLPEQKTARTNILSPGSSALFLHLLPEGSFFAINQGRSISSTRNGSGSDQAKTDSTRVASNDFK